MQLGTERIRRKWVLRNSPSVRNESRTEIEPVMRGLQLRHERLAIKYCCDWAKYDLLGLRSRVPYLRLHDALKRQSVVSEECRSWPCRKTRISRVADLLEVTDRINFALDDSLVLREWAR